MVRRLFSGSLVLFFCFVFLLNSVNAGPTNTLLGAAAVATSPKKQKINLDKKKKQLVKNLSFTMDIVSERISYLQFLNVMNDSFRLLSDLNNTDNL